MQRCMYVLFSRQNTKIGCFIRVFLRNSRYSHVALSLDENFIRYTPFHAKGTIRPFRAALCANTPCITL